MSKKERKKNNKLWNKPKKCIQAIIITEKKKENVDHSPRKENIYICYLRFVPYFISAFLLTQSR